MSNILLVGGAGYIGSHTAVELLNGGHNVLIADNFSNSHKEAIDRIELITNKRPKVYEVDTRDPKFEDVFKENKIDAVIDFAAYKSVGDSVKNPLDYYNNNMMSLISTLEYMNKYGIENFVFSSSATVYGSATKKDLPVDETYPRSTMNPYGATKMMGEMVLEDVYISNKDFNCIILRYFNPVGAHESGLIGEESTSIPANIMPYITKVAIGELPCLNVFGDDYDTEDGTGVRDYIHVVDLARGHVKALEMLLDKHVGLEYFNLGSGRGYSVMELINTFSEVSGRKINYKITDRRPGDIGSLYADCKKAEEILGWKAEYGLRRMCEDSWRWQSKNPKGYSK